MIKPIVQLKGVDFKNTTTLLRHTSEPVIAFDAQVRRVIRDLTDTIEAHDIAVGLSAVQIGTLLRLFVVDTRKIEAATGEPQPETGIIGMVNPEILAISAHTEKQEEACMSLPGFLAKVERPAELTLAYQTPHGRRKIMTAKNLLARVILHEIDHLDGILYIDRLPPEEPLMPADF